MSAEKMRNVKADELVEKFNKMFPIGSTVKWRSVGKDSPNNPHKPYTVLHSAENKYGQAVAWLKEKSGCVSIEPQFVNYQ